MRGNYSAERGPTPTNRFVINGQIPPVRFTGFGNYRIEIGIQDRKPFYVRDLLVGFGMGEPFPINVSLEADIDAEA